MKPVKVFGAISAVYLGIYLVLPGCLCQLLEAFGIPLHGQGRSFQVCVYTGNPSAPPCHCHHVSAKTADLDPSLVIVPEPGFNPADWSADEAFQLQTVPPIDSVRGRAPPSGPPSARNSLRTLTGVYLI
ncbi:MAG: hypothetical protein KDM64_04630 [Verrucomicrobiae bacterium]|nr:hypothetical protein [Verrucomicrobiae bacterium]MCB1092796.1 hypothetical protein [Verrucomicrobiae bacterium]